MNSVFQQLLKFSFLSLLLIALALSASACLPARTVAGDRAASSDHSHAEGEVDDHSHDDQGSTVIGEQEVKLDHHGNPVFDEEERVYEQVIAGGASLEFTIENFLGVGGRGGELAPRIVAGEHAVLQFHLTEAASGEPLAGLRPAVWLDLAGEETTEQACRGRVQGYLGGTLEARPMVDLNSYFILSMNKDNTISVIDPMVDVAGMTNLFAIILLQGSAQDWVMAPDQLKLFATMPDINKVAVIDLDGFQVEANVELKGRPGRIVVQPDGRYAWVGIESQNRRESGVAVIDVTGQKLASQIPTGGGTHSLAFSPDSHFAYVTNSEAGTLTVIDTQSLQVVKDLKIGIQPVAVAVASDSGAIYVSDQSSGAIIMIDAENLESVSQMQADRGVSALGISPGGRWGFAVNPLAEKIYLFDVLTNQITHAVPVKGAPDQVTFSQTAAYFRASNSPALFAIPFAEINPQGNISVLTVPVGSLPPNSADTDTLAQAVFQTPDGGALLVANPADDKVYFYTEGSQSALGGYQGHTLEPRAVQVVDRSLKERSPGVYTGGIRIPQSGDFVVAFLLNDPQIVHCFLFSAKPNPEVEELGSRIQPELKVLTRENPKVGELFTFQFEFTNPDSGSPVEGLEDVLVITKMLAGNWSQRLIAVDQGKGIYQVQLTFPNPGMHNMLFAVPSLGLNYDRLPQQNLRVIKE